MGVGGSYAPASEAATGPKRPPASTQPSLFRRHLVDSADGVGVAVSARGVSFALDLLAATQAMGRRGRLAECLARALLGALDQEGLLKWDEAFLDGSFAPAKKGVRPSGKPSGARARSGWYWSTVKVFRCEFGWKVPPPVKLSLRKPRSPKSASGDRKAARDKSRSG